MQTNGDKTKTHAVLLQPIAGEPFPCSKGSDPRHVELMRSVFSIREPSGDMVAVSRRECVELQAEGKDGELLDRVYERYDAYRAGKDLVLLEGTHIGPQSHLSPHLP